MLLVCRSDAIFVWFLWVISKTKDTSFVSNNGEQCNVKWSKNAVSIIPFVVAVCIKMWKLISEILPPLHFDDTFLMTSLLNYLCPYIYCWYHCLNRLVCINQALHFNRKNKLVSKDLDSIKTAFIKNFNCPLSFIWVSVIIGLTGFDCWCEYIYLVRFIAEIKIFDWGWIWLNLYFFIVWMWSGN